VRLVISRPDLAPALVCALNEADCVAARTGFDTVEVSIPWLLDAGSLAQAAMELLFFIRAWASEAPGFEVTLRSAL
jgi:hypothetical protein